MPDFSQPGSDGVVPFELKDWRRGTVYTVRPELLQPLERGRAYRSMAVVRRFLQPEEQVADFAALYRRAAALTHFRSPQLGCASPGEPLHTWIRSQTWHIFQGAFRFALVSVSANFLFPSTGQDKPAGEAPPTAEELLKPGGLTPEMLTQQMAPHGFSEISEIYNDFGYSAEPGAGMFSYGEFIPSAAGLNFTPFVERAETFARNAAGLKEIIAREWYCTTHPDLAVVHLYYGGPV
jgi:hypothetical protein